MRVKDAVGRFGEDVAANVLLDAGFSILERNWHAAGIAGGDVRGELDIVARDGDALVVVEVKTRSGTRFGSLRRSGSLTDGQHRITAHIVPSRKRRLRRSSADVL